MLSMTWSDHKKCDALPAHQALHRYERVVVDFFAELFNVAKPWGYVTSGGTQGNEQGLYIGRQFLKAEKWNAHSLFLRRRALLG